MLKPLRGPRHVKAPGGCSLCGLHFRAALTGRRGDRQSPPRGDMTSARMSRAERRRARGPGPQGQRQRLQICFQSPRETRSQGRREPGGPTQELHPVPGPGVTLEARAESFEGKLALREAPSSFVLEGLLSVDLQEPLLRPSGTRAQAPGLRASRIKKEGLRN